MRILYGVVGDGMGHAMRSRVILDYLTKSGYEVEVVASARACDYLAKHFPEVHRIHGMHIVMEENRIRRGHTLLTNLLEGAKGLPKQIETYFELIKDFSPHIVISDFESWSYLYAKLNGTPVLSIDNMQIIHRCDLPDELTKGERMNFEVARAFVQSKLPHSNHYFITSMLRPRKCRRRTTLHPPILRKEILEATPTKGDHLLVYQTVEGADEIAQVLAGAGVECRVYGMRRDITEDQVEGNLRYRPFSEQGFIEDLASCRGVIASSGFTLMGEAVYLHKPMLAVPVRRHFEQILNGRAISYLGYGHTAQTLTSEALATFMQNLPTYEQKLSSYHQDGNHELFAAIEEQIDHIVVTSK